MINLENMNRQHQIIRDEVFAIEKEIEKEPARMNLFDTALHINRLAGQLKIHLLEEDKYLYPNLLKIDDKEVLSMAKAYIHEMGDLAEAYTNYKIHYNVSTKIKENMDSFFFDTKVILSALKNRMEKEDNGLYRIILARKI